MDALQQNEVFDLFEDEFAQFVDEEYQHGDKAVTSVSVSLNHSYYVFVKFLVDKSHFDISC